MNQQAEPLNYEEEIISQPRPWQRKRVVTTTVARIFESLVKFNYQQPWSRH